MVTNYTEECTHILRRRSTECSPACVAFAVNLQANKDARLYYNCPQPMEEIKRILPYKVWNT